MKFRPTNTLAYFNAAPQTHLHDLSNLPTAVFSEATAKYRKTCGHTSPTEDAVSFYTLNHAASIIRSAFTANETLPDWAQTIMATYTEVAVAQGERMLHYILSITTREMRHLGSHGKGDKFGKIGAAAGPVMQAFIEKIVTMDESAAVQYYMNHPPKATIGQYITAMSVGFHKGGWGQAGQCSYGGPKWGQVADAAAAMLTGVTSMEMLVDTGFTLAHNGGPIFNKGMMYGGQDATRLLQILDVQRSGQMLDVMLDSNTLGLPKTAVAVQAVSLIQTHCPLDAQGKPTLKGSVDWHLVDALRPDKDAHPNKYAKLLGTAKPSKAAQDAKAKKVAQEAGPVLTTLLGKKVKLTGTFQVFPHQNVNVYERVGS